MKAVASWITSYNLDKDKWMDVRAPWACSYYMIIGNNDGSPMWRCSDTDDGKSFYLMPSGGWFAYSSPVSPMKKYRFAQGDIVTFLRATKEGTIVTIEFFT